MSCKLLDQTSLTSVFIQMRKVVRCSIGATVQSVIIRQDTVEYYRA